MRAEGERVDTWAIVDKDGNEYASPIGDPIVAPSPGFYSIRYPGRESEELPAILVLSAVAPQPPLAREDEDTQ